MKFRNDYSIFIDCTPNIQKNKKPQKPVRFHIGPLDNAARLLGFYRDRPDIFMVTPGLIRPLLFDCAKEVMP
jgi:hypothetical protein